MKSNRTEENNDQLAAIGIGAMIVFIALILVAAVAAAVIIQTAEKLQQNAQTTGDDTADNMAGKLFIDTAFVDTTTPGDDYLLFISLAPGSDALITTDISYQMFCANGNTQGVGGTEISFTQFDGSALATANTLSPGTSYQAIVDGSGGTDWDDCSANSGTAAGPIGEVQLYLHVANGGTTFETMVVDETAGGALVV